MVIELDLEADEDPRLLARTGVWRHDELTSLLRGTRWSFAPDGRLTVVPRPDAGGAGVAEAPAFTGHYAAMRAGPTAPVVFCATGAHAAGQAAAQAARHTAGHTAGRAAGQGAGQAGAALPATMAGRLTSGRDRSSWLLTMTYVVIGPTGDASVGVRQRLFPAPR